MTSDHDHDDDQEHDVTDTNPYAYRWQAAAHRVLGQLLAEAEQGGLPPLMWTLADTGALTGEVHGLGRTTDEQRAAVTAWARHLGASVTETPRKDGR
ncbi:hypothetical protein, partial [Streptomyces cucumeris]|uniref:hypothetical protein n=1 Tax=Streptomyces cucumeris TaxID=2962890 RepID=UPI003D7516D4